MNKKTFQELYKKSRLFLLEWINRYKKTKFRCKLNKVFTIKNFSKGDVMLLSLIFIYGAIMYTPFYKFIFFVITTNIGWLSGKTGMKKLRHRLEKAEQIIENPNVPISRKYTEAVEAVHMSCDLLGRMMERYNLKQGTSLGLKELEKTKSEENIKN